KQGVSNIYIQRTAPPDCMRWHLSLQKRPINRPKKSARSCEFHPSTPGERSEAHTTRRTGIWSDLRLANCLDHPFKQMLEKRILTAHKTHVTCFVQLVA